MKSIYKQDENFMKNSFGKQSYRRILPCEKVKFFWSLVFDEF